MIARRFQSIHTWADWQTAFRLRDRDTQDLIDLSAYDFTFEVFHDRDCCGSAVLSATTADEGVILFDTNTALVTFRKDDLGNLDTGQHYVRCSAGIAGETAPIFTGTVTVTSRG